MDARIPVRALAPGLLFSLIMAPAALAAPIDIMPSAEITAGMPLGEIPADDDVAEAIVFFASDRSRMITGQRLLVNAGELM